MERVSYAQNNVIVESLAMRKDQEQGQAEKNCCWRKNQWHHELNTAVIKS